jgi:hypothetical protein
LGWGIRQIEKVGRGFKLTFLCWCGSTLLPSTSLREGEQSRTLTVLSLWFDKLTTLSYRRVEGKNTNKERGGSRILSNLIK